jgi:hypothetical protein
MVVAIHRPDPAERRRLGPEISIVAVALCLAAAVALLAAAKRRGRFVSPSRVRALATQG